MDLYYTCEAFAGYPASSMPLVNGEFGDAAYDIIDLLGEDSHGDFATVATQEIVPKLQTMPKGAQVARIICGVEFIFSLSDIPMVAE